MEHTDQEFKVMTELRLYSDMVIQLTKHYSCLRSMVGSNYEKILRDTISVLVSDILSSIGPSVTSKFKDLFKFLFMPLALVFKYSGILALNKNENP